MTFEPGKVCEWGHHSNWKFWWFHFCDSANMFINLILEQSTHDNVDDRVWHRWYPNQILKIKRNFQWKIQRRESNHCYKLQVSTSICRQILDLVLLKFDLAHVMLGQRRKTFLSDSNNITKIVDFHRGPSQHKNWNQESTFVWSFGQQNLWENSVRMFRGFLAEIKTLNILVRRACKYLDFCLLDFLVKAFSELLSVI